MADVAIIGAGLAGLNAARALLEHGVEVELFEAADRVGGRARTLHLAGASLPIELGPEFVHGDPGHTLELVADRAIEIDESDDRQHLWRKGKLVRGGDVWKRFGKLLRDVDETADESARAYIEREQLKPADADLLGRFIEGFYGADLDEISIASVAEDAGGAGGDETPSQFHVRGGYSSLVDSLMRRVGRANLHLGCVVNRIDWRSQPVRIEYRRGVEVGAATAERVIVAVPLGVLHTGMLRFQPELGDRARELRKLAMGHVVKLVLRLREPVWDGHDPARLDFVHGCDAGFPTYWLRSRDNTHLLTAWAGGGHARALATASVGSLVERAVEGFARSVGVARARLAAAIVDHHFHDWSRDPYARGAYSYARVGAGDAVKQLAQPLGDRLFFAGEATDAEYEGTVAGALGSGARAAQQILDARAAAAAYRRSA